MTILTDNQACLCGSGLTYAKCCGRYHSGEHHPPTAEALMRSRFTAYALRDADYLLVSWDAGKRPMVIDFSKETAQWHKLIIVDTRKGGERTAKASWNSRLSTRKTDANIFCTKSAVLLKPVSTGGISMASSRPPAKTARKPTPAGMRPAHVVAARNSSAAADVESGNLPVSGFPQELLNRQI